MGESSASSSTPYTVFDYLGLGFILEPPGVVVHAMMTGEPLKLENAWYALPFIFIGASCIYVGRNWDRWKPGFNARFVNAVDKISKSYFVPFVLVVMFLTGIALLPLLIWPHAKLQATAIVIHEPPSPEDIAKAAAPIKSERDAIEQERDAARQQLRDQTSRLQAALNDMTRQRDEALREISRQPSLPAPVNQGPINWNADGQFLVITGGGPDATINSVLLQGTSTTSVAIKEAFAVSGLTGHKQELMANVQHKGYYSVDKIDIPPRVLSILRPSSTGSAGRFWHGSYRLRWKRSSVWRRSRRLLPDMASRRSSTPIVRG